MTSSPEPRSPNPQNLWKEQIMHPHTMTPQMLETRSRRFERRIRARNTREYLVGGVVAVVAIIFGTWMLLANPAELSSAMVGAGLVLLGLGAAFAVVQLSRRAGGRTIIDGRLDTRASYRAELMRQRDALNSIFAWYIAPFLPGFALIYGANLFGSDGIEWATLFPAVLTAIFGIWLVRANHKVADRMDAEIRALDTEG